MAHAVHSPRLALFRNCKFDKIFQFGDSLSDTGNLVRERPFDMSSRLPYGQSYFNRPTGRYSNGLIMIDYIGTCIYILENLFSYRLKQPYNPAVTVYLLIKEGLMFNMVR